MIQVITKNTIVIKHMNQVADVKSTRIGINSTIMLASQSQPLSNLPKHAT